MKHDISDKLNQRIKQYNVLPGKSSFAMRFDFVKRKGKRVRSPLSALIEILTINTC
jgi:hypothetical protein